MPTKSTRSKKIGTVNGHKITARMAESGYAEISSDGLFILDIFEDVSQPGKLIVVVYGSSDVTHVRTNKPVRPI